MVKYNHLTKDEFFAKMPVNERRTINQLRNVPGRKSLLHWYLVENWLMKLEREGKVEREEIAGKEFWKKLPTEVSLNL